ncbi:MAG: sulfite exporter TauE/SafE family protein [Marinovum sp.]|nr:sulfite exporter TauE/SafE family protein [Marinovum sp.]
MELPLLDMSALLWAMSMAIALLAGFIKGIVGFAMPLIMISLLGAFQPPDIALAGLILPTLLSNVLQAGRDGALAAWAAIKQFRIFLITAGVCLILSAQLYTSLSIGVLFLSIAIPVVLFCLLQIAGWRTTLHRQNPAVEIGVGAFSGFIGGLSAVWGPALVAYLTALNTEKRLQMRTQGAAFGLGSLLLLFAHGPSGVVRPETLTFSAILVIPAVIGTWLGSQIQDRINQETFRKATLWMLLIAGLNLLRRGILAL